LITRQSSSDFVSTTQRLRNAIEAQGLTLFCSVDHAAGAKAVHMELAPEEVFFFGNPAAGTPLMQADPAVGYELPLRIVVWERSGSVFLAYRDPRELAGEFGISTLAPVLERMADLLDGLCAEAVSTQHPIHEP
jgi:uncharacterized protein (DUF302 family)